ncbi:hypothetical protein [Phaffia rhodozyma]|uniref:Uncharacterized protein n=1 Tax=Phaffia rhodozyma TaxID=264483 RepID=A0A0F7SVN0_PHARH|nr:hypothetical protein [Phaffia rhodozyma]
MLLRFIPLASASAPNPPTILFTLPPPKAEHNDRPADPYAYHSLPAPPALISLANTCAQNDLPCSTILSGDSSSWISSIVEEVTFLPSADPTVAGEIQVLLIDGSAVTMPLHQSKAGRMLDAVRDHVLESARLAQQESLSRLKRDNGSSSFMSLLAPLMARSVSKEVIMPVAPVVRKLAEPVWAQTVTAKHHRRLARSKLVDCYRRWVLTGLKELLPPTYLLFTAHSILKAQRALLAKTESEIRVILSIAGLLPRPSQFSHSSAPIMPVRAKTLPIHTRAVSVPACPSSISAGNESAYPSAHVLPPHLGPTYTRHLSNLEFTQNEANKLQKLIRKFDREHKKAEAEKSLPPSSILLAKKKARGPSPLRESVAAFELSFSPVSIMSVYDSTCAPPLSPTSSLYASSSDGEDEVEEYPYPSFSMSAPVVAIFDEDNFESVSSDMVRSDPQNKTTLVDRISSIQIRELNV